MRRVAALFAGPVMTLAGINHFVMPQVYASIVPDSLPAPVGLVYLSGLAEIVGGLGTMHPRTRKRSPVTWCAGPTGRGLSRRRHFFDARRGDPLPTSPRAGSEGHRPTFLPEQVRRDARRRALRRPAATRDEPARSHIGALRRCRRGDAPGSGLALDAGRPQAQRRTRPGPRLVA